MKKALISPNEKVRIVTEWTIIDNKAQPTIQILDNTVRIVGLVDESPYDVAPPFFWKECNDNVEEDTWYYDMIQEKFFPIIHAENPLPPTRSSGEIPGVVL